MSNWEQTKYGQKLKEMVEEELNQSHLQSKDWSHVKKTDDAIYVIFSYNNNETIWNLLDNSKTKKLRDLRRALQKKIKTYEK